MEAVVQEHEEYVPSESAAGESEGLHPGSIKTRKN